MIMNNQEEFIDSLLKSEELLSDYNSYVGNKHLDMMNKLANELYKESIIPPLDAQHHIKEKEIWGKQPISVCEGDYKYYFLADYKKVPVSKQLNGVYKSNDLDIYSIRRDFPILHRRVNGRPLVWLDNSATTQKPQHVINAIGRYYSEYNSNIHRGAHTLAKLATDAYESAREKVRDFIGASSTEEIVFVRGATEAINLVAESFGRNNIQNGDEILISMMEHHSNIVPWQKLQCENRAVLKVIPINDQGEIIMEEYEKLLTPRTRIVAVTHVSNTLGTVNPVAAMIEMAHKHGAYVLVDGAQSVPHLGVDVRELDADFYVFSGHKVYGPTGIGVLYGKKALLEEMPPWQSGGGMIKNVTFNATTYNNLPYKFEAGTGNIADAIGLNAAIDYVQKIGMGNIEYHEKALTAYAVEKLGEIPGSRIIGTSPNKISVISFVLDGVSPENAAYYLNQEGIAVRSGHHCAQPALSRYGLTSTIRASLALYNTAEEVELLARAVLKIARQQSR